MLSAWPPPPPPVLAAAFGGEQPRISSLQNLSPSIIIIILILSITVFVSVSLCLLLRFLRLRQLRSTAASARRVSPEVHHAASPTYVSSSAVIDSLPLFTFSSVTRRHSSAVAGDCPVCLSKFEPNDQLRLLPLCCHAFHAECIDIWLQTNQSCPLCRSTIYASESDVMKALLDSSSGASAGDSFRLEIGSISRRQQGEPVPGEQGRSVFEIGSSFDYIVDEEFEIIVPHTHHRRSVSDKDAGGDPLPEPETEPTFVSAADVASGGGRGSWLKDYVDRLSASISSRSLSFRSSGRFFTGSSRRTEAQNQDYDVEANRIGEEISEMFRWFSGV